MDLRLGFRGHLSTILTGLGVLRGIVEGVGRCLVVRPTGGYVFLPQPLGAATQIILIVMITVYNFMASETSIVKKRIDYIQANKGYLSQLFEALSLAAEGEQCSV